MEGSSTAGFSAAGFSAAEVARTSGLPLSALRRGLWSRDDLVALQRTLLARELGRPDDDPDEDLDTLLAVLDDVHDRLERQRTAVRGVLAGTAVSPAQILDGFGPQPVVDEALDAALDELGRAWARAWSAGEPVDSVTARSVAARHRAVAGPDVDEPLAAVLDRHALGVAAYARDALAVG